MMTIYTKIDSIIPRIEEDLIGFNVFYTSAASGSGNFRVDITMSTYSNENLDTAILSKATEVIGETVSARTEMI